MPEDNTGPQEPTPHWTTRFLDWLNTIVGRLIVLAGGIAALVGAVLTIPGLPQFLPSPGTTDPDDCNLRENRSKPHCSNDPVDPGGEPIPVPIPKDPSYSKVPGWASSVALAKGNKLCVPSNETPEYVIKIVSVKGGLCNFEVGASPSCDSGTMASVQRSSLSVNGEVFLGNKDYLLRVDRVRNWLNWCYFSLLQRDE